MAGLISWGASEGKELPFWLIQLSFFTLLLTFPSEFSALRLIFASSSLLAFAIILFSSSLTEFLPPIACALLLFLLLRSFSIILAFLVLQVWFALFEPFPPTQLFFFQLILVSFVLRAFFAILISFAIKVFSVIQFFFVRQVSSAILIAFLFIFLTAQPVKASFVLRAGAIFPFFLIILFPFFQPHPIFFSALLPLQVFSFFPAIPFPFSYFKWQCFLPI